MNFTHMANALVSIKKWHLTFLECETVIPGCLNCIFTGITYSGNSKFNYVKCTQCLSGLYLDSYQKTYSSNGVNY
jgi:hypothetical protein